MIEVHLNKEIINKKIFPKIINTEFNYLIKEKLVNA